MNSHPLSTRSRSFPFLHGFALLACILAGLPAAAEPPVIPVGLDAYRQWDLWPLQRIGARAYMRSTYDRRGGNEAADASHFLYQLADDDNVTLDVEGAGILYFARYNHWHGSPWRYVVDGTEHIVQETSTADPNKPVAGSVFMPEHLFPRPLTWTWSVTKGADLTWVPIPFEKSFRMGYSRTHYGTGYYIYHHYVGGAKLSQPIRAWDGKTPPDSDVLELINRSGSDLAPQPGSREGRKLNIVQTAGELSIPARGPIHVARLEQAPSMLRALEFSVPREQALVFGRAQLRVTWDRRPQPSIDAPVALFYGAGTLYNRDDREYLVKAFPVHIRYTAERVHLACFFPMPFFRSALIELVNDTGTPISNVRWSVRQQPYKGPRNHVGYFHATYHDHPEPKRGHDLVLLDTRETEGGGHWSGSFVGTSFIFTHRAALGTLEGDPRFFFDDSQTPQAYGTGTEEWGGGGDYWGGLNMTLPFAGHPVGARNLKEAKNDEDKIHSAYRFLLADLMPFGNNAVIRLEHGGENLSTEHYQTVTYWYGAPSASLVKTDELKIGDAQSEKAHAYTSPTASAPYEITSRYEWGIDTLPASQEQPTANPSDFAEFEFEAEADRTYYIWVRGKNLDGNNMSDAFWMQFNSDIGTRRLTAGCNHDKGMGNWLDRFPANTYAWSSALPQDPPQKVTFAVSGKQRLRIQPRQTPHQLEQIWLSASQTTLPNPETKPTSGPGEIVLRAADANRLSGQMARVADAVAAGGQALLIGGGGGEVVYAPHTDTGRKMTGASEFTLALEPRNFGVLLRRKLDYAFPNQRAEIFVADADRRAPRESDWKAAGVWYLAGANTCVYSNPREELGQTQHIVQTSNRRFRDDEFLIPRNLTQGRKAIRVRIQFTPVERPLFPGHPLSDLAWSEIRYDAYCFVMPEWRLD